MSGEREPCPECTIDAGVLSRQEAWDAFWTSAHVNHKRLIQRNVTRQFVGDRADPTCFATLDCGHTVPA